MSSVKRSESITCPVLLITQNPVCTVVWKTFHTCCWMQKNLYKHRQGQECEDRSGKYFIKFFVLQIKRLCHSKWHFITSTYKCNKNTQLFFYLCVRRSRFLSLKWGKVKLESTVQKLESDMLKADTKLIVSVQAMLLSIIRNNNVQETLERCDSSFRTHSTAWKGTLSAASPKYYSTTGQLPVHIIPDLQDVHSRVSNDTLITLPWPLCL